MPSSGTKLVIGILALALALGAVSWWYRFETAHRATLFWGPEVAQIIAEPGKITGYKLDPATDAAGEPLDVAGREYRGVLVRDLTGAAGMVHLRHALVTDSNYLWMKRPAAPDQWRWALQFHKGEHNVLIVLTEDFQTLGKLVGSAPLEMIDCRPMAETLREYFASLGIEKKD